VVKYKKMEKEKLLEELEKNNWKVSEVRKKFNISKQRIYYWIHKFGIELPSLPSTRVIVFCSNCGKEIMVKESVKAKQKRFFCSPDCRRKYSCIGLTCFVCGKKFYRKKKEYKHDINRRRNPHYFCSKRCWGKYVGTQYGWKRYWKIRKSKNDRKTDSFEGASTSTET